MRKHAFVYLVARIAQAVLVLWAAYTVTYVILNLLPADPIALILKAKGTDVSSVTPAQLRTLKQSYGLDQGAWHQYVTMLFNALRGDFGTSYTYDVPVIKLISLRVGSTLLISALSIVVATVAAFLLAFLAAYMRRPFLRRFLAALPVLGASVPSFWVGLLLMQVFSFGLGWLPSMGMQGWKSLVLPTITMSIPTGALLAQLLIGGFEETMRSQYVTVARAYGLGRGRILISHVTKNASLPTLTILGLIVGETVTGAIVAETVFSRQGLGMLIQQSVTSQDIPVIQGAVVLAAGAFVLVNLAVDVIYPLLDPRIVLHSKAKG
jgi:peptide/nickel transport system permease protein